MKTIHLAIMILSLSIVTFQTKSQTSSANNNPGINKFLGYNGSQDLELRTNDDTHLLMRQNGFSFINNFLIDRSGFIGISQDPSFFNSYEPYSLLHLNGDNASGTPQTGGYRDWMRFGIVSTHNQDLMFMGQMDRGQSDQTSATIAWADNSGGTVGPDNLRFIFISGDGTASSGSSSTYGLETMRIAPDGNVGIGDFSAIGLNEQPTFRLDVDGNARFRQITEGAGDVLITGFEEDASGDYSLRYLSFSGNQDEYLAGDGTWQTLNNNNCEWNINGNDLSMGYAGACQTGNVGIGNLAQNDSKVLIDHDMTNAFESALNIQATGSSPSGPVFGINSEIVDNIPGQTFAVQGIARNGKRPIGGNFESHSDDQDVLSQELVGLLGQAYLTDPNPGPRMAIGMAGYAEVTADQVRAIGVYGEARNTVCGNGCEVAGYFAGTVVDLGQSLNISDETLKTDVADVDGANEILMSLNPSTYQFDQNNEIVGENLPGGTSYGFMAQEVQEILPDLVGEIHHPAKFNDEGGLARKFRTISKVTLPFFGL